MLACVETNAAESHSPLQSILPTSHCSALTAKSAHSLPWATLDACRVADLRPGRARVRRDRCHSGHFSLAQDEEGALPRAAMVAHTVASTQPEPQTAASMGHANPARRIRRFNTETTAD